ncbi:MAG: hypothetical protein JWM91_2929 [Rhodospirillales bacterium]|nr:hypothetical protein [Rhodospirillales bacterium]
MNAVANRQQIKVVTEDAAPTAAPTPPRFKPSHRTMLVATVAIAGAAGGSFYIAAPPSHESTEDAYIGADATTVAPKVRGLVAAILVRDNQTVHAGDPLVRIDPEEFDARVATATADLADAEAALVSLDAEERLAAANVRGTQTAIRAAGAQAVRADADRRRSEALLPNGFVARRDVDLYRAAAITAEQDVAHSTALFDVSLQAASVTAEKRDSAGRFAEIRGDGRPRPCSARLGAAGPAPCTDPRFDRWRRRQSPGAAGRLCSAGLAADDPGAAKRGLRHCQFQGNPDCAHAAGTSTSLSMSMR